MATGLAYTLDDVTRAVATMTSSNVAAKQAAGPYLHTFQKSQEAWAISFDILQSNVSPEAKHFAAITLKGKISIDLRSQVPPAELANLQSHLIALLKQYSAGPGAIRIQLAVCLALLVIQMTEWHNPISSVISALGEKSPETMDFLQVLPEELSDPRKINLSEEELSKRTVELFADANAVVKLLESYATSSANASKDSRLMRCISSWLGETSIENIVPSRLLDTVYLALLNDDSCSEAANALTLIFRETRESEADSKTVSILLEKLLELQPRIAVEAEEAGDVFKAITRVFAEAGEAWVIQIVREPARFRPLVNAILECCARDKEMDAIDYTFNFWDEFQLYLVLEHYIESRMEYVEVYSSLVDIMMQHLQYPSPESGDEADLFDGDREQEEKFRDFRHHMGDCLKHACVVMGVTDCLNKVLNSIKLWSEKYASLVTPTTVPHWQALEAPLFAMRAMGRMVPKDENVLLPQLIPLVVQIPAHPKLRFAAVMVLGRYTEWTSAHPEYLEPQFQYVVSCFESDSLDIVRAAAMSVKFFCLDCKYLLSSQVLQLQQFYDGVLDKLPSTSQEEITEGVAMVVSVQPLAEIYKLLKLYCDPVMQRLISSAKNASAANDNRLSFIVADNLQLINEFIEMVVPAVPPGEENPAVKYWGEVFPVLAAIVESFSFTPVLERACKCWRHMVISYRTAMAPILPEMANKLVAAFQKTRQGCFLWVTGAILREFPENMDGLDPQIVESVYVFFEAQVTNVLRGLSDIPAKDAPDVIEDFFRLTIDALLYYPQHLISSALFSSIFEAAISSLALEKRESLTATLHYLRDMLAWAGDNPNASIYQSSSRPTASDPQLKNMVRDMLATRYEVLVKQVLAGMMITFPRDCFADGSAILLDMFRLMPNETTLTVERTLGLLPAGTVTPDETQKLIAKIKERLAGDDAQNVRQVRTLLQDFTNSYRRRYVAPRDGVKALEASKFHFSG